MKEKKNLFSQQRSPYNIVWVVCLVLPSRGETSIQASKQMS